MSLKTVKISVIIPVYNMQKHLVQCLDSVVNQTLRDIEIICVNDGSTDNSLELINRFKEKDERLVVVDQKNQGVAKARNNALDIARGEYIAFMDPDDWYPEKDILEVLYKTAVIQNVLICGGSYSEYLPNGTVVKEYRDEKSKLSFKYDGLVFYKDYQYDFGYQRFIYNRSFLNEENIRFPNYRRLQEQVFFVNSMTGAIKFYAVSKTTYAYRVKNSDRNVWTEKETIDLISSLTDIMVTTNKYDLRELHRLEVDRLISEYSVVLKEILKDGSKALEEKLISLDKQINRIYFGNEAEKGSFDKADLAIAEIFNSAEKNYWKTARNPEKKDLSAINNMRGFKKNTQNDNPLVSVIIPIYNVEDYLYFTLSSVVDQTLRELEIIAVDDESPDSSINIVKEMMKFDGRITLISQKNGGLSAARNTGLREASGKYVVFLDSDDYIDHNAIETLYNECEKNGLELLSYGAQSFFEDEKAYKENLHYEKYYEKHAVYDEYGKGYEQLNKYLKNNDFIPQACMQMLKRDFLEKNEILFFEGILHEDNLFTMKAMLLASRVGYLHRRFYHRRVRNNSIMTAEKSEKNIRGYFVTINEMQKVLMESTLPDECVRNIVAFLKSLYLYNIIGTYNRLDNPNDDMCGRSDNALFYELLVHKTSGIAFEKSEAKATATKSSGYKNRKAIDEEIRLAVEAERERIAKSYSFRLGRFLLTPARIIKNMLKS